MSAPAIGLRPRFAPPLATAHIDWSHPLAQGLVGYWLPAGYEFVNLCDGPRLTSAVAAQQIGRATVFGPGNGSTTASVATPAYTLTAPANLQLADRVSMMWAGNTGTGSSNNFRLLSMEFNSTSSTPFIAYGIYQSASGQLAAAINSAGTFAATSNFAAANNSDGVAFLTYDRTTLTGSWSAGSRATSSLSGAITYGTNPRLIIGNVATNAAGTGCVMAVGAIWSRALPDVQQAQMQADPFCLLRY